MIKLMKIQTSVRVEDEFYKSAKVVFDKFGLSFADGVNIFLAKVAMEQSIPFDLSLPSDELKRRVNNLNRNKNTQVFKTANQLFAELGI